MKSHPSPWSCVPWARQTATFVVAGILCLSLVAWSGSHKQATAASRFTFQRIPASAVHHAWQAPRIRNANGTSSNWSGYAVYPVNLSASPNVKSHGNGKPGGGKKSSPTSTFGGVTGDWTVPQITASSSPNTYCSTWVGLDGYNDSTVEQLGTEQDWYNGAPQYYAWFEMYPKGAYEIVGFPVNPGDTISASVIYTSKGNFVLSIENVTQNVTVSVSENSHSAQRLSAEWIAEAPWSGGELPLADFGTVDFSNCYATMSGTTGAINDGAWLDDPITMESADGTLKAVPSALSSGGTAFSVVWAHE